MADITNFYPGGSATNPVPHADAVDDGNVDTALHLWSGTQEDYNTLVTEYNNDNTSHPNHLRTIYYTI